jgi:hypothetical protein
MTGFRIRLMRRWFARLLLGREAPTKRGSQKAQTRESQGRRLQRACVEAPTKHGSQKAQTRRVSETVSQRERR